MHTQRPSLPVQDLRLECQKRLCLAGIENAEREAAWLIQDLLQCDDSGHSSAIPSPEEQDNLFDAVARRCAGEPLQYVLGSAPFRYLHLTIGPGVLCPRPETEFLVDIALELDSGCGCVCDLCTGSGAIALALASERIKTRQVLGIDISPAALRFARLNRDRHHTPVDLLLSDLLTALCPQPMFGLVTANPPYVTTAEYRELDPTIKEHEPAIALLGGDDGLDILRRIAVETRPYMIPQGVLIAEIGCQQGHTASTLFKRAGWTDITIRPDLTGHDRYLIAHT